MLSRSRARPHAARFRPPACARDDGVLSASFGKPLCSSRRRPRNHCILANTTRGNLHNILRRNRTSHGGEDRGQLTAASVNHVKHVHILFQSARGFVGDGVFLFCSVPIELTLYNVGQLSSAAAIANSEAKRRKTSGRGTFMIHRTLIVPSLLP